MADPVKKPLTWSKSYPRYAERFDMYRVFQELLKELIIVKPPDPLAYVRDELPKIATQLHCPRVFMIGPTVSTQGVGRHMAQTTGSRYLTLADVVETAPISVRGVLAAYVQGDHEEEGFDDGLRKLLVATIMQRVRHSDCQKNGYILYGFPQNKAQAVCAQQSGLLPRQVYVLLPDPNPDQNPAIPLHVPISNSEAPSKTPTTNTLINPSPSFPKNINGGQTMTSGKNDHFSYEQSSHRVDDVYFEEDTGNVIKVSSHVSLPENNDYAKIKAIADCYDYEICKTIPFDKWHPTRKTDIEGELLANLVSVKPNGCPWIPRVLLIGLPSSGKSTMAEQLSAKFGFVNVDFMECVRGASQLPDDVGKACKKYLGDLRPMTDNVIKTVLQRKLFRDECERKGWILHGFPDTIRQLTVLDILEIPPNRIFYLACTEEECWARLQRKRQEVLERRLQGAENKMMYIDEMNFEEFPYGKVVFRIRCDTFLESFDAVSAHFGKNMIYVDGTQRMQTVFQFLDASLLRPPVIRFPEQD